MNHDPSSPDTARFQAENDALDLEQILAIDWDRPLGLTFRQEQRYIEHRQARSQRALDKENNVRCKCGTVATLGAGRGPHAARADCSVCGRTWWVPKSIGGPK